MVAVDDRRGPEHQANLALPFQCAPTISPKRARPASVIDLPERRQDLGLGVWPHVEDRAEVFEDKDAGFAEPLDLAQNSARGVLATLLLGSAREKPRKGESRLLNGIP